MDEEEQDEYTVPLQDQRVWGTGIKRRKITFVPAGSTSLEPTDSKSTGENAASKYLAIVLAKQSANSELKSPETTPAASHAPKVLDGSQLNNAVETETMCLICKAPLQHDPLFAADPRANATDRELLQQRLSRHESSIAHQVCLAHVHPPSAVDRSRQGARILSTYGWDPDARLGLGSQGQGILAPVKGQLKNDTMGIGSSTRPDPKVTTKSRTSGVHERGQGKDFKMDAGQVRKRAAEDKRKADRLRSMLYGDDKLRQYLGQED